MSLTDATACIMREMNRKGDPSLIPAEGGNDIDFSANRLWGPKIEPWETFKIRSSAGVTALRVFYRHPFTEDSVGRDVDRLEKRCLKVSRTEPGAP